LKVGNLAGTGRSLAKTGRLHSAMSGCPSKSAPWRSVESRQSQAVFEIGIRSGANCVGKLKIIAATLESAVIERILQHP